MSQARTVVVFSVSCALLFFLSACKPQTRAGTISGVVLGDDGPLAGAIVRLRTTENSAVTGADGRFVLEDLPEGDSFALTAWADGYYISGYEAVPPGTTGLEFHLHAHAEEDNPAYAWMPSTSQGEIQSCADCHTSDSPLSQREGLGPVLSEDEGVRVDSLPVDQWLLDAHSRSAENPRFLTMYLGQDMVGNQSPSTRYGTSRDYGAFPLRPDPDKPYYGPGYKLDFPDTAGNCAACHTPAAAIDNPYGIDPTSVSGVPAEGVPCDFCHKVWDVRLDQRDLPYANMPGVLSFELRRPPEGHQYFAGPLDDIGRVSPEHAYTRFCTLCHFKLARAMWPYDTEDLYSSVQQRGQFCAPCHFGAFWDTQIYNSYGEWLASPYSDPEAAQAAGLSESKSCQDCHMPPSGAAQFALTGKGGLQRAPESIFSHNMTVTEELLQNAVTLDVKAERDSDEIIVSVTLTNDQTGHHVPTDSPLRQMILLVDVTDSQGNPLPQVGGPTIPLWGGVENDESGMMNDEWVADRYLDGRPGMGYAKILQELWTEVSPTGAYWNPTRLLSDNRLPALGNDTTVYTFQTSQVSKTCEVSVRLLYRRAFIELIDQKGWDTPDILMAEQSIALPQVGRAPAYKTTVSVRAPR